MSQSFNQQAYQFHTVYQPENFSQAQQWYGQPEQPFNAADQYQVHPHQHQYQQHPNEEEHHEDDDVSEEGGDPNYAAALAQAAGVPPTAHRTHTHTHRSLPHDSSDSSENEGDDPATRIAKQLLRKRPSKTPPRHDFKKSQVRVRIREAKERLENATHAVQEAERAFHNAQQSLDTREQEWKTLNEELVDELLEAEKMRPWNKVYVQLQQYQQEHGHIALAARATTNKRRRETASPQETHEEFLGGWITRQRFDRNKGKLDEWKMLALERLGFVWDGLQAMWEQSYQKVKLYYASHGHINVSAAEDKPLNRWLKTQRGTYKDYKNSGFVEPGKFGCKMNRERKELLDALGMDWGDEDQDDSWWIEPFHQLRVLQERQGHLRTVPANETAILEFVKRQRIAYRKYLGNGCKDSFEMTAERVCLLDSIRFPWTGCGTPLVEEGTKAGKRRAKAAAKEPLVTISYNNPWMTQYNKVKAFSEKYNHLKYDQEEGEPKEDVQQMKKWDALQRKFKDGSSYKKYLSPERMELLKDIRFFQPKHELEFWFRLSQLRKFRARHGHCMIMYEYPGAPKSYQELAQWAMDQRKEYRKLETSSQSHLTEEKVGLLQSLGFNFDLEAPITPARAAAMPAAEAILAIAKAAPPKQSAEPKSAARTLPKAAAKSPLAKKDPPKETAAKKDPPNAAPAKDPSTEEPPAKRKRGRPRKNK